MAVNGSTVDTNVELIFKHVGHRCCSRLSSPDTLHCMSRGSIQDLNWNPESPWCLATVSEDSSEVAHSDDDVLLMRFRTWVGGRFIFGDHPASPG